MNRLREFRVRAKLTQRELAVLAGVSEWTIRRAEKGLAGYSSLTQEKIAAALGKRRQTVFPRSTAA